MTVNFQDRTFFDVDGCMISLYYPALDDSFDWDNDLPALKKDFFYCLDLNISDGSKVFSGFLSPVYDEVFSAFIQLQRDLYLGKPTGVIE